MFSTIIVFLLFEKVVIRSKSCFSAAIPLNERAEKEKRGDTWNNIKRRSHIKSAVIMVLIGVKELDLKGRIITFLKLQVFIYFAAERVTIYVYND